MLDDLDSTLKQWLIHELPDLQRSAETTVTISFDVPVESAITQKPAINLFLYDIRENLELRNSERTVQRNHNGTATRQRSPARIDCSYLITAWVNSDDPQQEHHILGAVMKLLLRDRTLPEPVLQGSLRGQIPFPVSIGLRSSYLQSLGEFWQAIGGKPKAVLHYTVTIAVPVDGPEIEVPLVLEKHLGIDRSL
ncbi:MAG: DUF4255 domain-containing protein [Synechococcales bacterium]|nr:DUF4255 domain-containing protein [Synechococcales bacterium]